MRHQPAHLDCVFQHLRHWHIGSVALEPSATCAYAETASFVSPATAGSPEIVFSGVTASTCEADAPCSANTGSVSIVVLDVVSPRLQMFRKFRMTGILVSLLSRQVSASLRTHHALYSATFLFEKHRQVDGKVGGEVGGVKIWLRLRHLTGRWTLHHFCFGIPCAREEQTTARGRPPHRCCPHGPTHVQATKFKCEGLFFCAACTAKQEATVPHSKRTHFTLIFSSMWELS